MSSTPLQRIFKTVKSCSHLIRITCNKSAVSLLQSRVFILLIKVLDKNDHHRGHQHYSADASADSLLTFLSLARLRTWSQRWWRLARFCLMLARAGPELLEISFSPIAVRLSTSGSSFSMAAYTSWNYQWQSLQRCFASNSVSASMLQKSLQKDGLPFFTGVKLTGVCMPQHLNKSPSIWWKSSKRTMS